MDLYLGRQTGQEWFRSRRIGNDVEVNIARCTWIANVRRKCDRAANRMLKAAPFQRLMNCDQPFKKLRNALRH